MFLRYGKYFGLDFDDKDEYFHPERNGSLVSRYIERIDPDFVYLQEFYFPEDAKAIPCLENYENRMFLDMWYRENGALIASKKPFTVSLGAGGLTVHLEPFDILPVHFNSFSPTRRFQDAKLIRRAFPKGAENTLLIGDTNLWLGRNVNIFPSDLQAYAMLCDSFHDVTKHCVSTTYFGFGLDKIFATDDVRVSRAESARVRGRYMDHFPVWADIG